MGNKCQRLLNQNERYCVIRQQSNDWAGRYLVMQEDVQKTTLIKKPIYFNSHQEAKQFITNYSMQEKPEFYIINPVCVELSKEEGLCNMSQIANVYHRPLLPTLQDRIMKTKQCIKQSQIWFILSELSHSLHILHDRGNPHLWLCPSTIYHNYNSNWFLHDMSYWRGNDYQNLINSKIQAHGLVSQSLYKTLTKGQSIYSNIAFNEDIYCLGYSIIYMMTTINPIQAKKTIDQLLQNLQMNYSKKLLILVRFMIDQSDDERITLEKLRFKLKMQQSRIFKQQIAEYKKQQKKKSFQKRKNTGSHQQVQKQFYSRIQSSKSIHLTPIQQSYPSIPSTNVNSPFYSNNNRKDFIFLSPPSRYRPTHPPQILNIQQLRRSPSEFRLNSPRQ